MNRRYKPRRGGSNNQGFFRSRRHGQNSNQYQNGPIRQGDGTWYDPDTGEYFKKETLWEMLGRWWSALTGRNR